MTSITPLKREDYNGNQKEFLPVDGESKIFRDKYSKALLLNDEETIRRYKERSEIRMEQSEAKAKLAELEQSVAGLKEDVYEIKQLLKAIVNRN